MIVSFDHMTGENRELSQLSPIPKREKNTFNKQAKMKETRRRTARQIKQRYTTMKWLQTVRNMAHINKELQGINDLCLII